MYLVPTSPICTWSLRPQYVPGPYVPNMYLIPTSPICTWFLRPQYVPSPYVPNMYLVLTSQYVAGPHVPKFTWFLRPQYVPGPYVPNILNMYLSGHDMSSSHQKNHLTGAAWYDDGDIPCAIVDWMPTGQQVPSCVALIGQSPTHHELLVEVPSPVISRELHEHGSDDRSPGLTRLPQQRVIVGQQRVPQQERGLDRLDISLRAQLHRVPERKLRRHPH
uniref:Uncharacterized protein n=1 Tax=Timema bartmani TaxID=61472 RepID=A0A7R9HVF9_9NEOP|nr:unnamed protein product [Timema bartmani]